MAVPAGAQVLEFEMVKETQFWFPQYADIGVSSPALALYSATFAVGSTPSSWMAGQAQSFPIVVTNTGNQVWPSTGTNRVRLSAHFAGLAGGTAVPWLSDVHVDLPADLAPGANATIQVSLVPLGAAPVLEFQMVKEGQFWFSQYGGVSPGVLVPNGVSDPWSAVVGIVGAPTKLLLSPSGSWRLLQTNTGLYRSMTPSGSWQSIGRPPGKSGTGKVAIDDDGVVYMLSDDGAIYPTKQLYRFSTEWVGPSLLLSGPAAVYAGAGALATSGSKLVAIELKTGRTAVSTDKGSTWVTTPSVYPSDYGYDLTVLGGYLHVLSESGGGSQAYSRFSLSTNTTSTIVTGIVGWSAKTLSLPGSTSSLFIASGSSTGTVSIRKSTDSGATWSTLVSNEPTPVRAGVSFGLPVMGADARMHFYGSAVESGQTAVYDAGFDPVAKIWAPVRRTQSLVTSGTLAVWPTQRADATVATSWVWVLRPASTNFWAIDASTGSVSNPWVTTTSASSGSTVIEGLTAAPTKMVLSPSGAWRLLQTSSDLYRSAASSGSWERVGRPAGKSGTGQVAIGDDGVVFMLSDDGATYPTKQLYRFTTDWYGPSLLLSGPSSVYAGAGALVTDGSKLVAIELRTGRTAVSTDKGNTWATTASIALSNSGYEVSVLGGYMHVLSDNGAGSQTYSRFSLSTNALVNSLTGIPGFSAKVLSSVGSVAHLWIAATTGPWLAESLDSGAT
ncbi:MAG: hypothetical protein WCC60_08575, partial [Ilumatobacteraceae bacterium]